jgi:hypothetical protein
MLLYCVAEGHTGLAVSSLREGGASFGGGEGKVSV